MLEERATIDEMVEALLVFDEAMLNARYHGMLDRVGDERTREKLAALPSLVLRSARAGRRGAEAWMAEKTPALDDRFLRWGERTLLESFLSLTESQLRLIASMARTAPTRESRAHFEEMSERHRQIAACLRDVLANVSRESLEMGPRDALRSVQEEEPGGDLRGQVEKAIRSSVESGRGVRSVLLSATALRRLRDQGCFQEGETSLLGAPVLVDLGWGAPAFALQTFDVVPLEEIVADGDAHE